MENTSGKRRGGGCIVEFSVPVMFVIILTVALFAITDTPPPTVDFEAFGNSVPAFAPPVNLPSVNLPVSFGGKLANGSLAGYTSGVQAWESKILEWERRYNVDRHIIATIMQVESCGDPSATSPSGAIGLFQVMPLHFTTLSGDPYSPDLNAGAAMWFFLRMHEYTGYDVYRTFAGYNGGYAAAGTTYQNWSQETQLFYTLTKGVYDDMKAGRVPSPTIQQIVAQGRCPA